MPEPTVLDYVKAKITFWKPSELHFPDQEESQTISEPALGELKTSEIQAILAFEDGLSMETGAVEQLPLGQPAAPRPIDLPKWAQPVAVVEKEPERVQVGAFPWRISLALLLALEAQIMLNPPTRSTTIGIVGYLAAAIMATWGFLCGEWNLPAHKEDQRLDASLGWRRTPLFIAIPLALLTFLVFGPGLFTTTTVILWLGTVGFFGYAFWSQSAGLKERWQRLIQHPRWNIAVTPATVIGLVAVLVVIFFRAYQLIQIPAEMVSDHAEKLLDVWDVLHGHTAVFFPRNTGREFFQFYLTAGIISVFHTGYSFLSLKIGTVTMGLLTLPFVYLIGKELGNRKVGYYAAFLAGIAYWPNVISRIALRFTLYPAFAAPTLYFLIRGLRRQKRSDFVLAGIFLGLGLHGYTSFRIMPFVIVAAVALYLIHRQSKGARYQGLYGLVIIAIVSFAIFLPLFRYAIENPDMFAYRAFTRLGTVERPLPGPAGEIFLSNLWNAMTMFFWSDGDVWVHSVPYRPALDTVSAALFFMGMALVTIRYLKQRHWADIFLIVSVPLLLMPSILSLAFPNENPALNRTAGAFVPVFVLVGFGMDAFITGLKGRLGRTSGRLASSAVLGVLLLFALQQNYQLVFKDYAEQYRQTAWNTSEMGRIMAGFAGSVGSDQTSWVVAYPYWVDTRLVGMNAGFPTRDYAIEKDKIPETQAISGPKLFLVNLEDSEGLNLLKITYPQGSMYQYASAAPGKDFIVFLVLPEKS